MIPLEQIIEATQSHESFARVALKYGYTEDIVIDILIKNYFLCQQEAKEMIENIKN